MTIQLQFSNNASSRLAANITSSATSLSVTPGDGVEFPVLGAGQWFMATLVKADGTTEVVKVTARSTDTFTIVRAAEAVAGVTASYAFTAGDKVEARLTAGSLGTELSRLDAAAYISALNKSANYTVVEADISSLIRVDTGGGTRTITLPSIASLTDEFNVIISKVTSDANTLTIARASTDTINGATSYVLYSQFQSAWLIADRTNNTWTVITSSNSGNNVVVDPFTGDGTTTAFTLSGDPISKNNTALFIGGVYQNKASYTLSGTTITPGGTVATGVKIEVVWTQPLVVGVPSDASVTTAKLADGALAATTGGLAKMADGFLAASTAGLAKMADGFLAASSAGLAKMADGFLAATTAGRAKMADLFVSTAKLDNAAVTTVKIADSNVTTAKLANGAATLEKLDTTGALAKVLTGAGIGVNPTWSDKVNSGTSVATTSGTAIDFTGIPSSAKRITVMLVNVSTTGTSAVQLQIGSGSIATSGYTSYSGDIAGGGATGAGSVTTAFALERAVTITAAGSRNYTCTLVKPFGNTWLAHNVGQAAGNMQFGAGSMTLAGVLDRVRITTANGTDTFDAGSINILWE